MKRRVKALAFGGVAVLAGWIGWGLYSKWSTESVPYDRLRTVDGIELRRYPETVAVETTAPDDRTAFQRLFRYISGTNRSGESVSMTTPVETQGESLPMTTPVRSQSTDAGTANMVDDTTTVDNTTTADDTTTVDDTDYDGVRMAFYLPTDYDAETAPEPIDPAVSLRVDPETTVAIRRFSWYAPAWRLKRMARELRSTLQREGITPVDEPFVLRYDAPWTPPFMRRNEVAVVVELETEPEPEAAAEAD